MNLVYGVVLLAFALMTWRGVWVMRQHIRQGHSVLEQAENP
jgi:TRAP-type C4-dicarboxylate transport system permease small subunit